MFAVIISAMFFAYVVYTEARSGRGWIEGWVRIGLAAIVVIYFTLEYAKLTCQNTNNKEGICAEL